MSGKTLATALICLVAFGVTWGIFGGVEDEPDQQAVGQAAMTPVRSSDPLVEALDLESIVGTWTVTGIPDGRLREMALSFGFYEGEFLGALGTYDAMGRMCFATLSRPTITGSTARFTATPHDDYSGVACKATILVHRSGNELVVEIPDDYQTFTAIKGESLGLSAVPPRSAQSYIGDWVGAFATCEICDEYDVEVSFFWSGGMLVGKVLKSSDFEDGLTLWNPDYPSHEDCCNDVVKFVSGLWMSSWHTRLTDGQITIRDSDGIVLGRLVPAS